MASRVKLLLVVIILTAIGGGIAAYKHVKLGLPLRAGALPEQWLVEAKITFLAAPEGGKVSARLSLPAAAVEEGIGQEAGSVGYNYYVEKDRGEYTAIWASEKQAGNQAIYYRVSFPKRQKSGGEPITHSGGGLPVSEDPGFSGAAEAAAKRVVQRAKSVSADPDSLFVGIFSSINAIDASQEVGLLRKRYEDEAGGRSSAIPVLGVDLLNLAGVPARLAYGVRLEEARGGQQPTRLVEYYDGADWKVRDPDEPESTLDPEKMFVWNRGGGALFEVNGEAEASQLTFTVIRDLVPLQELTTLRDSPLLISTIFGLPASEQAVFRYVVLIPLGAFVVVVLRNIVGIATLGTFMPVLLALALLEMDLYSGLIMFSVIVAAGLWFRFLLSRLNMLVVPRVAACVVIVTLLMMVLSVVSYKLGLRDGLQITLFPMIILAWTIERMSLIWEEEGKRSAILQVGGSLFVAVIAFLFMSIRQVQYWAFYFPELLLVLLSLIILIGRYTGYRLSELFRFRDFKEA
ncbi:inactive transglutaminase family protein [Luteolibacter arcticus]|uniref:Inactive transglutaminase family protein n=1 Tax=Luteolibacter arcticus TaxID=1581411 RepID=A0ABT3GBK3_9BACT|nr:inactive transglutaminase family protein [Luteolibacter arcticus]MCW1921000.1 inactive transglutaminase family protein [Luteolibacter arcticus]